MGIILRPQIVIIFKNNGKEYKIIKNFKNNCLLEESIAGKWQKKAEGDRADKKVLEIVGGKFAPVNGKERPDYWGLGQNLWMIQGKPIISDKLNDDTLSALQTMIGATMGSEKEKKVLDQIKTNFTKIYTEKTKALKRNCELLNVEKEIKDLNNKLSEFKINQHEKEELIKNIEDNEVVLEDYQFKLNSAKDEKNKITIEVETAHKHKQDRLTLENEIQTLQYEYNNLKEKIDEIKIKEEESKEIQEENENLNIQIQPLDSELTTIKQELESKRNAYKELTEIIENKINEKNEVGIAHTTVMNEDNLKAMKQRLEELNTLENQQNSVQEEYEKIIAPTQEELEEIEKLDQDIRDTRTHLEAIGLNVKATAKTSVSGEILLDDNKVNFSLKNDETVTWNANQTLKIKLDDIGEFEILSGSQDVKGLKDQLENLNSEYQGKISTFEVDSVTNLKELYKSKESFKTNLERIGNEISVKSGGSKEALLQDINNLKEKIQFDWNKISDKSIYKKQDFEDKITFRTKLSDKVNQLQDEIDDMMNQRKPIYGEIDSLEEQTKNLDEKVNDLKTKLYGNDQSLGLIQKRLDQLTSDGLSTEDYDNKLNILSFDLDQKTRACKVYQDEIDEKENQPIKTSEELNNNIESLEKEIQGIKVNNAGMESKLEVLSSQSTDTCSIEENLAQLKNKENELELEAKSIKLLYELTDFYHEKTIDQLSEPIRAQVNQDLEKIIGPKYSLIFSKKMKPESINVNGEEADINNLSYGAQEQIWYLFRLALGVILSKDEPQLVVLDDPLVNTDPERMQTALQILQEYADKMQIIVVTCDVDKYSSLKDAKFISLAEIS